jgi:hypothetical protein
VISFFYQKSKTEFKEKKGKQDNGFHASSKQ